MKSSFAEENVSEKNSNSIEIISIGTELLLGSILNTNAKWIAFQLSTLGINHYHQTVVGDDINDIKSSILKASQRSQVVITTGGLGPTPDDLTIKSIASAFNTELKEDYSVISDLEKKLGSKNINLPKSTKKQALIPIGAEVIPNSIGTAPGIIWEPIEGFTVITFPGVPKELKEMWQTSINWLKKGELSQQYIVNRILMFTGIKESSLTDKLGSLMNSTNPTLATYASIGEIKLHITAKAKSNKEGIDIISPIESKIKKLTDQNCFSDKEESLASVVIKLLKERNQKLAISESCTGGGLGAELTRVSGASEVFLGGIIAYNNSIKRNLLNVSEPILKKYGAVSAEVVEAMAKGTIQTFQSHWAIAISGIAGPGGASNDKPVGLIEFCIIGPGRICLHQEIFTSFRGREAIQRLGVLKGLDLIRLMLLD